MPKPGSDSSSLPYSNSEYALGTATSPGCSQSSPLLPAAIARHLAGHSGSSLRCCIFERHGLLPFESDVFCVLPAHRLDDLPPGSVNAVDLCQGFHTRRLALVKRAKQHASQIEGGWLEFEPSF